MSHENILVSVGDGVATVTLNRPEIRNALGQGMAHDLHAAFADLTEHPAARMTDFFDEKAARAKEQQG